MTSFKKVTSVGLIGLIQQEILHTRGEREGGIACSIADRETRFSPSLVALWQLPYMSSAKSSDFLTPFTLHRICI